MLTLKPAPWQLFPLLLYVLHVDVPPIAVTGLCCLGWALRIVLGVRAHVCVCVLSNSSRGVLYGPDATDVWYALVSGVRLVH